MASTLLDISSASHVFIGEITAQKKIKTITFIDKNGLLENIEININGNLFSNIIEEKRTQIKENNARLFFQNNGYLKDLKINGFIGTPIVNSNGNIIGIIASFHIHKLTNYSSTRNIFEIFSATIGSEMERMHFEKMLKEHQILLERKNKQLHEAKDRAEESNLLKTLFLQNLSHEIRTPLNGIVGFADLLTESHISEKSKRRYVKVITESSQKLLRTVSDVLDISRIQSNQIEYHEEEINLENFLNEILNESRTEIEEKGLKLLSEIKLEEQQTHVVSDKSKITRVLRHLLNNAIKFTSKGFIKIKCNVQQDRLLFEIQDTGIGIETDNPDELFEHFRQLTPETSQLFGGAGIGLSICKGFVEALKGKIWFTSVKNEGSVFSFFIPFHPVQKHGVIEPSMAHQNPSLYKILIAEDEEINFMYLEALLKDTSTELIHVSNGAEALYTVQNSTVDLVLMDLQMPVMGGIEATRKIKQFNPDLPIIMQTAFCETSDQLAAKEAGCDDFFSKPIDGNTLKASIHRIIHSASKGKTM